jgi:excisionase family DNA binding protein
MLALCTYTTDKCGSSELVDIVSNHRIVLVHREGKWELIRNTRRPQASTLRRVDLREPQIVREVDLSQEWDSLLTIKEVSKILHVHTNTIRKWVDKGSLRTYRINLRGDLRFKQKDLDNFLSEMPSTGIKWHR